MAERADSPAEAAGRDFLGRVCFWVHIGVVFFVVVGWLVPSAPALIFYVAFLPAMFLQWRLNRSSCVLNNIESLLRTGRWRNPENREEGAWLKTLAEDSIGIKLTTAQTDAIVNSIMFLLWMLGTGHLIFWYIPDRLLNPV